MRNFKLAIHLINKTVNNKTLKNLSKKLNDQTLIITKADKGNIIKIMTPFEYLDEMNRYI